MSLDYTDTEAQPYSEEQRAKFKQILNDASLDKKSNR
jgi:hypothetical protein